MAQRTACLCNGKYIGIESIFTIVNEKQINIPEKVETLRKKSRNNELKCPCGCGAILILVAGDRNLREQHFRLKNGEFEKECHIVTEGKVSVDSKIVLKCWLDDKLKDANIESRVPICAVDDIKRKYEFTLLSKEKSIAVSYSHERANLSDDKFEILEGNSKGIKIIYIVDQLNRGTNGQYPESLMKIQARQGYCLYLTVDDIDYYKANLDAVFLEQDIDGLWKENSFAKGPISQFDINENKDIIFKGKLLNDVLKISKKKFYSNIKSVRMKRKQEELEQAEKRRLELERLKLEKKSREEAFMAAFADNFKNQDKPIRDVDGNRWIKCEFCGKIAMKKEFSSYGGVGRVNLGRCYDCLKNNPVVFERNERQVKELRKTYDPNVCSDCGGQLKEKNGRFGPFIGCTNYPKCGYTRKISGKKY